MSEPIKNSADESPASVAQTVPTSDHPHLKWMQEKISEEFKRRDGGGGGGNMSDLERRVGNLETDVRAIRDNLNTLVSDVAVIKSNYATKSDIASLEDKITQGALKQTQWTVGTVVAVAGIVIAVQRLVPPANIQQPVISAQAQAPVTQYSPVQNQAAQQYMPAQAPVTQYVAPAQAPTIVSQPDQQKISDH